MEQQVLENQYSSDPYKRICLYCGDSFTAHHGLQRYCPNKYGIVNYCKNQQKQKVNEKNLANLAKEVNKLLEHFQIEEKVENNNHLILEIVFQNTVSKRVKRTRLINMGFDFKDYPARVYNSQGLIVLKYGDFYLDWVEEVDNDLIFKVYK